MLMSYLIFFFNDTATTEIYTLSLHDALPIYWLIFLLSCPAIIFSFITSTAGSGIREPRACLILMLHRTWLRSEEHTSELQSRQYLVCRLLLEKKKKRKMNVRFTGYIFCN